VPGRILDLSEVAAHEIGIYRLGVAQVKIEAFPHPGADPLGRWCVQTGPFHTEGDAVDLKSALVERYRGARVSEFPGSSGFWVRIDPANRSHADAVEIADWIGSPDAQINSFLVRVN
jgi:rare lipoprotein A